MARTFSFREQWTLAAPVDRVHEVLIDLEHYPAWWREVRAVAKVDDDTAIVLCRSVLPYTLELELTAVHRKPELLETTISGDLVGEVRWRLTPAGGGSTTLGYEQDVVVGRPLLAAAAYAGGPVLRWNHRLMMASCREGLSARLR